MKQVLTVLGVLFLVSVLWHVVMMPFRAVMLPFHAVGSLLSLPAYLYYTAVGWVTWVLYHPGLLILAVVIAVASSRSRS